MPAGEIRRERGVIAKLDPIRSLAIGGAQPAIVLGEEFADDHSRNRSGRSADAEQPREGERQGQTGSTR